MSEPDRLLLDTHVWLWLALGDDRLPPSLRTAIESAHERGEVYVSAVSLLEVANMVRTNRVQLPMNLNEWFEWALSESGIGLVPVSPGIAAETLALPEGFHGDPADRLIAASARVGGLTLCTRDKQLLRYSKAGLFPSLKA